MRYLLPIALLVAMIIVLLPAQAAPPRDTLFISEFMALNSTTITDEDGDFSDWIELYNPGPSPILLGGLGLSDTPDKPLRWQFPEMTLEPDETLLVWASGKDRRDPHAPLHTNFSLRATGETILLTRPLSGILDQAGPVHLPPDVSLGRVAEADNTWRYLDAPTPGAPNAGPGYAEILPPPTLSHPGGFYTQPFSITLQATDPEATILYTLDGSEPALEHLHGTSYTYKQNFPHMPGDAFGQLYTATFQTHVYATSPLDIQDRSAQPNRLANRASAYYASPASYAPDTPVFKGTVVRARLVKPGALPGPIVTHTYFVTPEGFTRYGLPVVALTIQENRLFDYAQGLYTPGMDFDEWRTQNPQGMVSGHQAANYRRSGRTWEYPVHVEYWEPATGHGWTQDMGFRLHGGWSRHLPKKSLRLIARPGYSGHSTVDWPIFPALANRHDGRAITSFSRILLRNGGNDSMETQLRDAFIHSLLRPLGVDTQAYRPAVHFINGEYWGLINLRETIDPSYYAAHYGLDPGHVVILEDNAEIDEGTEADRADFLALRDYIATHDMADPLHFAHVRAQMDMDNFIRYHVAQIYIRNTDWPQNNVRMWRTSAPLPSTLAPYGHDGRWRWTLFDLDRGFAEPDHDTLAWATAPGGYNNNNQWSTIMLRKLLANPEFRHQFINTMADTMNTIFQPDHVEALLDATYAEISPWLPEHVARWSHGNTPPDELRHFAQVRPAWMIRHLLDYFALPGVTALTFNVNDPAGGYLRVNSVDITAAIPGLPTPNQPYPWHVNYFMQVPVTVTAVPHPGYRFTGWNEMPQESAATIVIDPAPGLVLTARFEPAPLR